MSDRPSHTSLPTLAIVVAMTYDRVIGNEQGLPWELPQELQNFKRLTLGSTVIMGRKTFDTIGRPLPERHNIVLSRQTDKLPNVQVCNSFISALIAAWQQERPIFIIGGRELFSKALPLSNELHISWIKGKYQGNRFFPDFELSEWRVSAEADYHDFRYIHYHRHITK